MVSDEGAYLNGYDAAPPPLSFLTVGLIASYLNEIDALAKRENVEVRHLVLTLDNFYSMSGSTQKRTMVGGALPVELQVEIDCDLDDAALNSFLMNAVHAAPLNGLMRGVHDSLFKLAKNGTEIEVGKAAPLKAPILADPESIKKETDGTTAALDILSKIGLTPQKDVRC